MKLTFKSKIKTTKIRDLEPGTFFKYKYESGHVYVRAQGAIARILGSDISEDPEGSIFYFKHYHSIPDSKVVVCDANGNCLETLSNVLFADISQGQFFGYKGSIFRKENGEPGSIAYGSAAPIYYTEDSYCGRYKSMFFSNQTIVQELEVDYEP